ncbi:ABC transporter permease [Bradyrhizobium campsiandrae]|uniref:ABC transporter permease n=1 Tax=Bradyrhizobium campsiandrae TaxID=1729892 RepID=UPI001FCEFF88|nr:hypothetical protein [Bradyrhizobium campsiandrae]
MSRHLKPVGGRDSRLCSFWRWQLIADLKLVSPVFLPGPDRAWAALARGFSSGDLASKLIGTLEHMAYSWLAASIAGIALGALIGSSRTMRAYVAPSLEFLRPLPVSAIIPVATAMLGLTQGMALFALILSGVCEILAGLEGLGQWVLLSARAFRSADLFAGVILLGATGYLTSIAMSLVEQRLLAWQSAAR